LVNANLEDRSRELAVNMLNEQPIPMPKQMWGDEHSRLMPTTDRKHGPGAPVFDTGSNAEAGLKTILDGRPTEAQPVVSSLIYEIVAEG
jgi:hypothetical protein